MKCPHCNVEVHESWQHTSVDANGTAEEAYCEAMGCPHCRRLIARTELYRNNQKIGPEKYYFVPQLPNAGKIAPEQVPQPLKDDYWEACAALSVSAKASAALSRRILQTMLKAQGYDSDNLATQIQNASCLSMKVRSPMPCSCSCLSPTRSQRRRRELHGADSDMAQRLETAMAHTLRLGSLAELHG